MIHKSVDKVNCLIKKVTNEINSFIFRSIQRHAEEIKKIDGMKWTNGGSKNETFLFFCLRREKLNGCCSAAPSIKKIKFIFFNCGIKGYMFFTPAPIHSTNLSSPFTLFCFTNQFISLLNN